QFVKNRRLPSKPAIGLHRALSRRLTFSSDNYKVGGRRPSPVTFIGATRTPHQRHGPDLDSAQKYSYDLGLPLPGPARHGCSSGREIPYIGCYLRPELRGLVVSNRGGHNAQVITATATIIARVKEGADNRRRQVIYA